MRVEGGCGLRLSGLFHGTRTKESKLEPPPPPPQPQPQLQSTSSVNDPLIVGFYVAVNGGGEDSMCETIALHVALNVGCI